jgi:hypothetical protein
MSKPGTWKKYQWDDTNTDRESINEAWVRGIRIKLPGWDGNPKALRGHLRAQGIPEDAICKMDMEDCYQFFMGLANTVTFSTEANTTTGVVTQGDPPQVRQKQSTAPGDATAKLLAALVKFHKYEAGHCAESAHVGCNELGRLAKVESTSTPSKFFRDHFGGWGGYRALCLKEPPGVHIGYKLRSLLGEDASFNPDGLDYASYGGSDPDDPDD